MTKETTEYYSGFVVRNITPYQIVAHSFNLINGSIVDLARMTEDLKPMEIIETMGMPHTYYGIKIPKDFIMKYEEETFNEKCSMNPVIIDYYRSIRKSL